MAESNEDLQEKFNDFDAFRAQFPTLDELRLEFESRDVGLHRAVAQSVLDFIGNYTFPKDVKNTDEKAKHFFGLVDDVGISKSKIVNASRRRRNADSASVFISLLRTWGRSPETVKARKRNAAEVLKVFCFLTHHVMDDDGRPRRYYWARIMKDLIPEDELQRRRDKHFGAKTQGQSEQHTIGERPVKKQARSGLTDGGEAGVSRLSTERVQQLRDRLIGHPARRKLYYRLDYSDRENAFKFDPETFRHSSDEEHLDDVLIELSIMGGMIDRGEAKPADLFPLQGVINVFMGSAEVDAYLDWLITPEEMPDDLSFLGAIDLYEQLGKEVTGGLARYRENARNIIDESFADASDSP